MSQLPSNNNNKNNDDNMLFIFHTSQLYTILIQASSKPLKNDEISGSGEEGGEET